jgi:hypothetical protein
MTHAHLAKKYGKWGKVLGSGAGGTVRIIQSKVTHSGANAKIGGAIFAVKEFRAKRPGETEKEYQKKVLAQTGFGAVQQVSQFTPLHRSLPNSALARP